MAQCGLTGLNRAQKSFTDLSMYIKAHLRLIVGFLPSFAAHMELIILTESFRGVSPPPPPKRRSLGANQGSPGPHHSLPGFVRVKNISCLLS